MRAGIVVNVTQADRHRLEAIVSDRSAPQKHVWRANIILATAEGCGTAEIMRRSGRSKPVVWRWQARFMTEGVDGLTRDKTRKPGRQPLSTDTVQRVVDLALGPPPGEETHWTGRMLAKAAGVSLRSVRKWSTGWQSWNKQSASGSRPANLRWLSASTFNALRAKRPRRLVFAMTRLFVPAAAVERIGAGQIAGKRQTANQYRPAT
jgi:hypothetical protein